MKHKHSNKWVLLILSCIFAAPGLFAYFFYTHPSYLVAGTTHRGQLFEPPVPLPFLEQKRAQVLHNGVSHGFTAKVVSLEHQSMWSLILWSKGECLDNCLAALDELARIRLALGRHLYAVRLLLLVGDDALSLTQNAQHFLRERDVSVMSVPHTEAAKAMLLQDNLAIFIANYDNGVVFAYQPTVKPGDIFHDLKRLLTSNNTTSR